jgi:glycosyltransferase involved in cell wall biosynthesis
MRVALVVHDFDSNFGQGRYCVEIARRLRHHCALTVYANTHKEADLMEKVTVRHVRTWRRKAITTVFSFIPSSERIIRREKFDIIHAQGLSCWRTDVITGHICNAARLRKMRARDLRSRLFIALVIPFERAFYRQRRARRLIAISHVLEREIRDEYGWRKPVDVIYHGTNIEQFRPALDDEELSSLRRRFMLPPGRWTWLFVGEAIKGLRQVIDQLPHFPDATLLVISRSDLSPYRVLAANLNVTEQVMFRGFDEHPELAFRTADAFVYPNDYDPFGMVGAEAMASGMPVILGRGIGVAELVEHGISGLLCDPHDASSVRAQLEHLRRDRDQARRMGNAARDSIMQHSWDICARSTLQTYEAVMRERGAR